MPPFSLALLAAVTLTPPEGAPEYRQPQLAVHADMVALTFGARHAIYFAASRDQGRSFSSPVKVAEGGMLALGRHRGPRIALTGKAVVISAIVGEQGGGKDGDIVAFRSTDAGKTWSGRLKVSDAPGAGREGLHAMAGDARGRLLAVWLDLRSGKTELWGSLSTDHGATWSKNRLVYQSPESHICECCHPSAAIGADGRFHVMWRNWLAGARDMYLASSADGATWTAAVKLGDGTWPLKACPMDGGGVSVAADGAVWTAWRREDRVFLSRPGAPEIELGRGKDPAIGDGVVAWSEGPRLWIQAHGSAPVLLAESGAYVSLAKDYAAWESKGAIVVQRVTARGE
jgi:hypothetical protein